ncbi:DUF2059 domain-containing protein [Magnetovirga frankeli]|uniref:DUF2059 domain-containing protein n=1 Tax=Magnetovirga frankeli TaxID=947516 RepID=UPI001293CEE2|nr:DUF2059 domain-containing protein [gamma proteobacterium SS-5]
MKFLGKYLRHLLVSCLLLLPALTGADEQRGASEVRELLQLSGAERQYSQLLQVMTRNIQTSFSTGLAEALKQRPLGERKRSQAKAILDRNFGQFITRFQTLMKQTMPWERLVRDVYIPVYLRHFSQRELQDLVAFYRSPTGRKFARNNGQLVQDATRAIKHEYGKQLQQRAEQLSQQTLRQITQELDQLASGG